MRLGELANVDQMKYWACLRNTAERRLADQSRSEISGLALTCLRLSSQSTGLRGNPLNVSMVLQVNAPTFSGIKQRGLKLSPKLARIEGLDQSCRISRLLDGFLCPQA